MRHPYDRDFVGDSSDPTKRLSYPRRRVSSNHYRPRCFSSRRTGPPAFAGGDAIFAKASLAEKDAPVHHSATVGMQQPRANLGELLIMRAAVAIIGILALGGCAAEVPVEQPTMYLSMANGGANLDSQAAASVISPYRQKTRLG